MLDRSGKSLHTCITADLRGDAFNVYHWESGNLLQEFLSHCGTLRLLNKVYFEAGGRASNELHWTGQREASNLDRALAQNSQEGEGGNPSLTLPLDFGMSERIHLLLGLWTKSKVSLLFFSFSDLASFHPHIWLLNKQNYRDFV